MRKSTSKSGLHRLTPLVGSNSAVPTDARDECYDGLPSLLTTIPLTVVVSSPKRALASVTAQALQHLPAELLVGPLPLDAGDPRTVADLVVLDDTTLNGISYLIEVRARWPSAVILSVNVDCEKTAAELFELGADYVLRRGASLSLVRSVIRAAGRRMHRMNADARITLGDLTFDKEGRRVWCAGHSVSLTTREHQLFQHLFQRAGRVVSYRSLAASAWRVDPSISSNGIAVYVGYLRRKLQRSQLVQLVTVRGEGYALMLREAALSSGSKATRPK